MFELMVPNDFKDGLGQLSNVVFVLDGETAAYPWELMTDAGDSPLCTRLRMVRQLQSATFRQHLRVTTSRYALVVGDPKVTPPFQQLAARFSRLTSLKGSWQRRSGTGRRVRTDPRPARSDGARCVRGALCPAVSHHPPGRPRRISRRNGRARANEAAWCSTTGSSSRRRKCARWRRCRSSSS